MKCNATRLDGSPCTSDNADHSGRCPAHRDGARERLQKQGALGGRATAAKHAGAAQPFTLDELPDIQTIDDAKSRLDLIQRAVLMRRITHGECGAASRCVAEWIKGETAKLTNTVIVDLQEKLDAKERELDRLRSEVAKLKAKRAGAPMAVLS